MLSNQRREKIMELLKEDGSAKVIDLARIFKVSDVTIRQDLEKLEKEGLITREHGGAYLQNVENHVKSFSLMNQEHMDSKKLIGKKAAEYVEHGDTVILDSGSTITELAKHLIGKKNLTVITNALNIALLLPAEFARLDPRLDKVLIAGQYLPGIRAE